MQTKLLYKDGLWQAIAGHPKYDLGQRELAALIRFLPAVAAYVPRILSVLHLASSTGREVPAIVNAIPGIQEYVLNDIVPGVVERSRQNLQVQYPNVDFLAIAKDVEIPCGLIRLAMEAGGPVLIILVANGVIFSNHQMDENTYQVMEKEDLFLLTVEQPHDRMFDSYLIPPVFELLSQSGHKVDAGNICVWYDDQTATMHIACEGEDLLVSYKPTPDQLHRRMTHAWFEEVVTANYDDLRMLAGLYRRG